MVSPISRRVLLASPATALLAAGGRPRVACILNVWFPNSHADVFLSRLLDGYRLNQVWHAPRLDVFAFYVDQFPLNDMAREQAEEHAIRIFPSVPEALRVGGSKLAVDAVAVIGEHGDYPRTPRGNFMYPRWRYFDQIARVMPPQTRRLVCLLAGRTGGGKQQPEKQSAAKAQARSEISHNLRIAG